MAGTGLATAAALTGAVPSSVQAQTADNFISGTVTDPDGNAVENAVVDAVPHDSSLAVLRTTTDANGDYSFTESDLYSGEELYHVICRNGTESNPEQATPNYPYILANGGSAIPDSVTDHWPQNAGSGTTSTNEIGTVDIDLNNGGTWTDRSAFSGGTAPSFDGTDDYWVADNLGINGSEFTVMQWTYQISPADDFGRILSTQTGTTGISEGWRFYFDGSSATDVSLDFRGGGSNNTALTASGIPDPSTQDLFWAITGNGDSARLLIYDSNGKQVDQTGTASRDTTTDTPLRGMVGSDSYVSGDVDDVLASTGTELTESEVGDVWNATLR